VKKAPNPHISNKDAARRLRRRQDLENPGRLHRRQDLERKPPRRRGGGKRQILPSQRRPSFSEEERRRQDLNLQIQRTLVFETSAIPGYATSAFRGPGDLLVQEATLGEAPKWPGYLRLFVRVRVEYRPRRRAAEDVDMPSGSTVGDLLRAVGQGADSTLVVRGKDPIPEDERLREGDDLLLLSAFSGG
jgi:sulfur carrier protein ThiS